MAELSTLAFLMLHDADRHYPACTWSRPGAYNPTSHPCTCGLEDELRDIEDHDDMADKLDKIASAISTTMYDHGHKIGEGYRAERQIMWDDADYLRQFAKQLRGPLELHDVSRRTKE